MRCHRRSFLKIAVWMAVLGVAGCRPAPDHSLLENSSMLAKEVIHHFSQHPEDSLELKAAHFLLQEMEIPACDSCEVKEPEQMIAEQLIRHIREKVLQLKTLPWLKGMSFEEFCEYLLPYWGGEESYTMTDSLRNLLRTKWEYAINNYDDCLLSSQLLGNLLLRSYGELKVKEIPDWQPWIFYLRELGIPVSIDFLPLTSRHSPQKAWIRFWDGNLQNQLPLSEVIYKQGKVFRKTYSSQPIPIPTMGEYIPPFFRNPFQKDVTAEYLHTHDLTLELPKTAPPIKNLYLALFHDTTWTPIAWSEVKAGRCHFKQLAPDKVYLPLYYQDSLPQNWGMPFLLQKNGTCRFLTGQGEQTHLMVTHTTLHPKRSDTHNLHFYDFQFESADDSVFTKNCYRYPLECPDPLWREIVIPMGRKQRYWRIVTKSVAVISLSEMQFIDRFGNRLEGTFWGQDASAAYTLVDHRYDTHYQLKSELGVDFGHPVEVVKIRYLFSQKHRILQGHRYELSCFQAGTWKVLDVQTSQEVSIRFDSVPANALYRLCDLETLEYSPLFTIENHKVRFW